MVETQLALNLFRAGMLCPIYIMYKLDSIYLIVSIHMLKVGDMNDELILQLFCLKCSDVEIIYLKGY